MYSRYDPNLVSPWKATLPAHANRAYYDDNFLRPMAGLGDLYYRNFEASSNYDALQVSVRRRMTHGLSYGLAYTFWEFRVSSG